LLDQAALLQPSQGCLSSFKLLGLSLPDSGSSTLCPLVALCRSHLKLVNF
jgi:hypothetical protein